MIIAIAYNGSKENVETILSENEIFLPVLMDSDGRITELYGVESVPVTFIINGDGTLHNAIPPMQQCPELPLLSVHPETCSR